MIVLTTKLHDVFEAVKADMYSSEERSVIVFVSCLEADSVCAMQQLVHLFASEDMIYNQFPVSSYHDISRLYKQHVGATDQLCTIVLVNCGGTQDIRQVCDAFNANVRFVIFDSHRPLWHGYNNEEDRSVLLMLDQDDPVPAHDVPQFLAIDAAMDAESAQEEAEEEAGPSQDGDATDGEEDGAGGRRRSGGGGGGDNADPFAAPGLRRRAGGDGSEPDAKRQRREGQMERRARRSLLDDYYEGKNGWGRPCSMMLYDLVHCRHKESTFQVWLAILGLTEQHMQQRVDSVTYERWNVHLNGHLTTLGGAPPAEDDPARDGLLNQRHRHSIVVLPISDLRLTLHKHWTLFESMKHTNYVAARLQTWRERGLGNLKGVMAKMGFPVKQAERKWNGMLPELIKKLPQALTTYGPQFNLNIDQLQFNSFEFQFGHEMRWSACDMVYAITATLARPVDPSDRPFANFTRAGSLLHTQTKDNVKLLVAAVSHAKQLATAIVQEGGLAITRQLVHGARTSHFCWLNLAAASFRHSELFVHPSALIRLAIFLRDAQTQRLGKAKPFVLVGAPDAAGNCYVVSLRSKHQAGVMQTNPFGKAFRDVLDSTGIQNETLGFDTCLCYMKATCTAPFIDELLILVASAIHQQHAGADAPL